LVSTVILPKDPPGRPRRHRGGLPAEEAAAALVRAWQACRSSIDR